MEPTKHKCVLMAVHAHPDDESLGTGGTLARYVSQGVETVLVCATKGEEGEILNPAFQSNSGEHPMSHIRLQELRAACTILGIQQLHFLGYRDSGMAGSPSNDHPEALNRADIREAVGRLVQVIRKTRPHVVITYNEKGLYGHPDHIAVNRITVAACETASDSKLFPELPTWRPKKLYYTAIPRSRLLEFAQVLRQRGEPVDFDPEFLGTPDEKITTRIDVGPFLEQKLRAVFSHRSQIGPQSFVSRMDDVMRKRAFGTECYVCVFGCSDAVESDLFEGIA